LEVYYLVSYNGKMELKDIEKLAKLARIEMTTEEMRGLQKDMKSILDYVDQIQSIDINNLPVLEYSNSNVFREDTNPHQSGIYTDNILKEAPDTEDNYIKVQKIL